ncbi:hypothetical protein mRhiFer1_009699 [Rhinolophus ferrumequinum]|uniref:Uncharacterized protein n=1 Tax=Rhinolophus ferrumequinum TaxID=59479 RepID=A0A7J7R0N7_RHIFE|nr:hypothetical protein mRhiFer1_009699 [Rhinolophus ferrumequinum]
MGLGMGVEGGLSCLLSGNKVEQLPTPRHKEMICVFFPHQRTLVLPWAPVPDCGVSFCMAGHRPWIEWGYLPHPRHHVVLCGVDSPKVRLLGPRGTKKISPQVTTTPVPVKPRTPSTSGLPPVSHSQAHLPNLPAPWCFQALELPKLLLKKKERKCVLRSMTFTDVK